MGSAFDDLMTIGHGKPTAASPFDQLMQHEVEPELDCATICPAIAPEDPPPFFGSDGLLKLYCWALVYGPQLPEPATIPHPGVGMRRWTHLGGKHWRNGVTWARQALRCVTRTRLRDEVAKPLVEAMAAVQSAPKGKRRAAYNAQYRRRQTQMTTPLPLRQADKLLRIVTYKLAAKQRNESLWPSQEAFWRGAQAALLAYRMAWSEPPASDPDGDSIEMRLEDEAHTSLYLDAKKLEGKR